MLSPLEKAQAQLDAATARYEPLQAALERAQDAKERHAREDRDAILKAIAKRDPARIKMMELENKVAELSGDQAIRIGENGG